MLVQRGFESVFVSDGAGSCARTFLRADLDASANESLEKVCAELTDTIPPEARDWKAFVRVIGAESAWATLQAGKPPIRGSMPLPDGSSESGA